MDEDGIAHLAGLGNAHILLDFTVTAMEGEMSVNRAHQPELNVPGVSPGDTDATYPTKAGDMYAFGFIIFEVRFDFSYSILSSCSLEADSHGTLSVLRADCDGSNVLNAERG